MNLSNNARFLLATLNAAANLLKSYSVLDACELAWIEGSEHPAFGVFSLGSRVLRFDSAYAGDARVSVRVSSCDNLLGSAGVQVRVHTLNSGERTAAQALADTAARECFLHTIVAVENMLRVAYSTLEGAYAAALAELCAAQLSIPELNQGA